MGKSLTTLVVLFCYSALSHAGDIPIIGIDPLYWDQVGWTWGAANDPNSVTASPNGIVLDIDVSDASDWPGTTNGGAGVDTGEILVDFEEYQLDVQLRVLEDNIAPQFRITIGELDTPATGEEYQYHYDLDHLDVGEWTEFSTPLSEWNSVFTTGGDTVPESPLDYVNVQTMWGAASPLNIEIGKVFLSPINPDADGVVFELNAANASGGFTFDGFQPDGAVVNDKDTIAISANTFGGLAMNTPEANIDAATHDLVVRTKRGTNNEAEAFRVMLKDNDGFEKLDEAFPAEEWFYEFSTNNFGEDEFADVRVSLNNPLFHEAGSGAFAPGDATMNFGLFQIGVQNIPDIVDLLELEIESVRIVERTSSGIEGDFNDSGVLDVADIDTLSLAIRVGDMEEVFDLNNDNKIDAMDMNDWVRDLSKTYFGDSNLDGEFNSSDFVFVFAAGKYESGQAAGWGEGDWNGDGEFNSSDFVVAFADGGYEKGPRPAVVPEPICLSMLLVGLLPFIHGRKFRL